MIDFESYEADWREDSSGCWISFRVHDKETAVKAVQEIVEDKSYQVTVKEKRKRRSLDANAYFWVLCGKLAEKTETPVSTVYKNMIKDLGGNYYVMPIREDAVEQFRRIWENKGLGWVTRTMPSKLDGYINVVAYYGSSEYDSKQIARLIDLAVFECEQVGIPTVTENELMRLKAEWRQKDEHSDPERQTDGRPGAETHRERDGGDQLHAGGGQTVRREAGGLYPGGGVEAGGGVRREVFSQGADDDRRGIYPKPALGGPERYQTHFG